MTRICLCCTFEVQAPEFGKLKGKSMMRLRAVTELAHLDSGILAPGCYDAPLLGHGPHPVDAAGLRHLAQVHDGRALLVSIAVIVAEISLAVVPRSLNMGGAMSIVCKRELM